MNSHFCEAGMQTDREHVTRCPHDSLWGRWKWRPPDKALHTHWGDYWERNLNQSKAKSGNISRKIRREDPALLRLASAGEVVWTEERSYFVGERCKNGTAVVENSMRVLQWFKCRHTLWSRGHTGYVPGRTESWGLLGYACIPTSMGIFPGPTRYSIPSIQRGWVTRWPVEPMC